MILRWLPPPCVAVDVMWPVVAVRIDTQAFRDSIAPTMWEAASRLRESGGVDELEKVGGGVQAVVRDGSSVVQPWVGIVDGGFASECECPSRDDLCVHAVAVVLMAFDREVRWSGAAIPPSAGEVSDEQARYARAADRLSRRQLAVLVVEQAGRDRRFAAMLLREGGLLDVADQHAVHRFRRVLDEVAGVTSGSRWQISDVQAAGQHLVAEVEILCVHRATREMADLLEQAILCWDELSGHLIDAHYIRTIEPGEIGEPLVEAHAAMCEQLGLEPVEVARRLTRLVNGCQYDTVDTSVYAASLGDHADTLVRAVRR
jgi:hypothetical protein